MNFKSNIIPGTNVNHTKGYSMERTKNSLNTNISPINEPQPIDNDDIELIEIVEDDDALNDDYDDDSQNDEVFELVDVIYTISSNDEEENENDNNIGVNRKINTDSVPSNRFMKYDGSNEKPTNSNSDKKHYKTYIAKHFKRSAVESTKTMISNNANTTSDTSLSAPNRINLSDNLLIKTKQDKNSHKNSKIISLNEKLREKYNNSEIKKEEEKHPYLDYLMNNYYNKKNHNRHKSVQYNKSSSTIPIVDPDPILKDYENDDNNLLLSHNICLLCSAPFSSKIGLKLHKINCHSPYLCKICHKRFPTSISLADHNSTVNCSTKKPYPCRFCNKILQSSSGLQKHLRQHSKLDYQCLLCERQYVSKKSLSRHEANCHALDRQNKCEFCEKSYYSLFSLRNHIYRMHRDNGNNNKTDQNITYKCELCEKVFKQKMSLDRHRKYKHELAEKFFLCDICSKTFITYVDIKRHILNVHSNIRNFVCNICDMRFGQEATLKRHVNLHMKYLL